MNSWRNRYEPQLRQMFDVSYDFFVHALMLLYKEMVEAQIAKKSRDLDDEFWEAVL